MRSGLNTACSKTKKQSAGPCLGLFKADQSWAMRPISAHATPPEREGSENEVAGKGEGKAASGPDARRVVLLMLLVLIAVLAATSGPARTDLLEVSQVCETGGRGPMLCPP